MSKATLVPAEEVQVQADTVIYGGVARKIEGFEGAPEGSRMTSQMAHAYGTWFLRKAAAGEEVTPRLIVDEAKPVESPLHPHFDWDDASAADKHRLHEARLLRSSLRIRLAPLEGNGPSDVVRAGYVLPVPPLQRRESLEEDGIPLPLSGRFYSRTEIESDPATQGRLLVRFAREAHFLIEKFAGEPACKALAQALKAALADAGVERVPPA